MINRYDNALRFSDEQLGRIHRYLELIGELDNTLWIVTTDHGEAFFDKGLVTHGKTLYEFETSKLTNLHTHGTKKEAIFSYNKGNFFGLLSFDTTKADPEITFQCITIDKESVYQLTLKRSALQAE